MNIIIGLIIVIFVIFICIVCVFIVYRDEKKIREKEESILNELGLKQNVTYKLTNKHNGTVYYMRIDSIMFDEVISYVCNTNTCNIGAFKNSKAYLLHIIEDCNIEEGSEWNPQKEPKI